MIKEKVYYYIRFKLESPLSIGNGDTTLTAHDCIRNLKGDLFIPATSLAGVFYHYLSEENRKMFNPEINGENLLSPYFISDAQLNNNSVKTSIRDGVKLTENKTAEKMAKYNFEVVETGAEFDFRIELTIRENDDSDRMKRIVDIILNGLNSGEILLGFKSKRGYGKVSLVEVRNKKFESKDLNELLEFNKYDIDSYDVYEIKQENTDSKYDYIEVELKQLGGISIRRYSTVAGQADFEHIKSNGVPIIPGTSWTGVIRRQVGNYIKLMENELSTKLQVQVDYWFGTYNNGKYEAIASNIIVEESTIKDSKEISITRNKIDRFSGSVANRALFTEKAVFDGTTKLRIKVKKQIKINGVYEDNNKILGLIALALKDIDNGLIALGGQTSIGRGIFKIESCKLNNKDFNLDEGIAKIIGGEQN